jgi:hypothetical protein
MTNKILTLVFLISVGLTSKGCSQTPYDNKLISTEKELNFISTDKRGIKDDNGTIYLVEKDGQTLTAYNGNEVKWTVNIIKTCRVPAVGKPEIRYLKLTHDKIQIVFGKHDYASVDIRDGKAKYLGAD